VLLNRGAPRGSLTIFKVFIDFQPLSGGFYQAADKGYDEKKALFHFFLGLLAITRGRVIS